MRPCTKTKGVGLVLLLLCCFLASQLAIAAGEEEMLLDLKVNQAQRGEFVVFRSPEGDYLIRLSDAPQLGLRRDIDWPLVRIAGEQGSLVSLRGLGATRMELDSSGLALDVELPPDLFETTAIDTNIPDNRKVLSSQHTSGFLNYRLAETSYAQGLTQRTLATELGLRYGPTLFLNQSLSRDDGSTVRYLTQLVYDRIAEQQRLIAGDFTAVSSELGSAVPMGGINFSKLYALTPDFIPQPLAGFAGVATSPSTVEVRIGGVPVAYSQVATGPYELQNLRQYSGASNVQVVVRDALGREQLYNFPFYFADRSLREGLHEYSYSLGKIRIDPGLPDDNYGPTAFSAFHRYGLNNHLTLGARAEGADNLNNLGVEASWRSDQWGVLSGGVSASNYQGHAGDATLVAYNYQQPIMGAHMIARSYSDNYAPLEVLTTGFSKRGDYGLGLSWYPQPGTSFNLNHTLTQTRNQGDTHVSSLSYFQSLNLASMLYATLQRTDNNNGAGPNTSLFVGWFYRFDLTHTLYANAARDEAGQQTLSTQFQKDTPNGEGVGYRVGWTGSQPQNTDRFNGFVQWNLPAASLSLDANTQPAQGGAANYHEAAVAGSVAFAGPYWGFSRTINDSFAIVQLGAPLAGVQVTVNSQDIGASDAHGQVISPYLGSFYQSQVAVNDQQVPLAYTMDQNTAEFRPAYRSGVAVNFGLRRVHGLDGVIRVRLGADTPTADDHVVTLSRDGHVEQQFQIGHDGHFYLENITPGTYQGAIQTGDQTCHFVMQVPDSEEIVFRLPGDLVCEYVR